jgi:Hydrazine synthase alpha subunit middle domain
MGDNKTLWLLQCSVLGLALAAGAGCTSTSTSTNNEALPADVQAITFLQRTPRNDDGNVFDYNNFVAGGRLVMLSPPSTNGKLTVVFPNQATCAQILGAGASSDDIDHCVNQSDIQSYDLSFDAKSVVMSAQVPAAGDTTYQLYSINLDGSNLQELTSGGNDFVYPVYAPGDQILFMTNRNVEADTDSSSQQFKDEYERAVTAQAGTVSTGGTGLQLGPRNVSHRVSPALLPDGHVMYTEWMHMGEVNEGHLRMMNTDMTGMKEAFGDELGAGNPSTNSYLKARYVKTTQYFDQGAGKMIDDYQVVAVATSRDRTLQSGKLFLIDLNGSEANSASMDITPLVPGDRSPSSQGIGRYYDAEPVGDEAPGQFLTSWSDGPVQTEELARAMSNAQFGIFLLDTANASGTNGGRSPIYDDKNYWDILARPVKVRAEPANLASPISATDSSTTVGALNVYTSSLLTIPSGSVVKVRLIEGFSGEEGGVDMFGTTEFDGQSKYGEIPLQADGSFAADVPANVPLHIQLVDKFGLAVGVTGSHGTAGGTPVANEDIWFSGRAGESRFCGGCHENRTVPSTITPGETAAAALGPINLDTPRPERVSSSAYVLDANGSLPAGTNAANPGDNGIRGVPWDLAIQPILDAHCVSCHDGSTGAQNPSYTVTDMTSGTSQTFTFDLRGNKLNVTVGERMTGDFTTSYLSLMGLGEILGDDVVQITGTPPNYVVAAAAEASTLMTQYLNPPQRYPTVDMNTRLTTVTPHLIAQGQKDMTADEYYLLGLNIDMGGEYFFRENLDEAGATP